MVKPFFIPRIECNLPSSFIFLLYRCIIIRMDGAVSLGAGFRCDEGDKGRGGLLLNFCSSSKLSPEPFNLCSCFPLFISVCGLASDFLLAEGTGLTSSRSSTSTGITALGMDSPLLTTGENIFLVVFTITSGETSRFSGAFSLSTKT